MEIADIRNMLDMRSDTGTLPTPEMRRAMAEAELGDGGRTDLTGRGEDPTVHRLERLAADITGKEEAIFFCSGSLANHAAMYTAANRGDAVLAEEQSHIWFNEKSDFMERFNGLVPVGYRLTEDFQIDPAAIAALLDSHDIKVLCIENTHNYSGGTCLTPETTRAVCDLARSRGVHSHLDGARVFNAAVAQGVDVRELTGPVDSLMFCISKGLGAPVGSLLAGSAEFITRVRETCKLMGTLMRQAGVIAAAGISALEKDNITRLKEDHAVASRLGALLQGIENVRLNPKADQTNFVYVDVSPSGLTAQEAAEGLRGRGLLAAVMTEKSIRLAARREVSPADAEKAAGIVREFFASLR